MWAFYAKLEEPKELVVIDGADHLFEGKTAEVGEALEELLGGLRLNDSRCAADYQLMMNEAVIVSAARTAVGKAPNGTLRHTRPDEMAAAVIDDVVARAPGFDRAEVEDVILGCAMPEAEQGLNVARIASLRAGVPVSASAVTINRFCSSGLQAIAFAAERIMAGLAQTAIVAGGTESMSLVPMGGHKVAPNPGAGRQLPGRLPDDRAGRREPRARAGDRPRGTGRVRAAQPSARGRGDRRGPVRRRDRAVDGQSSTDSHGRPRGRVQCPSVDEGPRRDTSLEALASCARPFTSTAPSRPATRRR